MEIVRRTDFLKLPDKLRTDLQLANDVRAIAEANCRTIPGQILYWIRLGVTCEKETSRPSVRTKESAA